jgi:hypothetical protein
MIFITCTLIDISLSLYVKFMYFMFLDSYIDIILMHIQQNFGEVYTGINILRIFQSVCQTKLTYK